MDEGEVDEGESGLGRAYRSKLRGWGTLDGLHTAKDEERHI